MKLMLILLGTLICEMALAGSGRYPAPPPSPPYDPPPPARSVWTPRLSVDPPKGPCYQSTVDSWVEKLKSCKVDVPQDPEKLAAAKKAGYFLASCKIETGWTLERLRINIADYASDGDDFKKIQANIRKSYATSYECTNKDFDREEAQEKLNPPAETGK